MPGDERAPSALFWVSFIESSFFPIPPDVMLVPMVIAQRLKAWWFATIATIGSVIGGVFGYAIGYFFFEQIDGRSSSSMARPKGSISSPSGSTNGASDPDREGHDSVSL